MRARFAHIGELIATVGLERGGACQTPDRTALGNAFRGRDGIARALYVTAKDRRVVVLRVFVKKTRRTPRGEIELALQRAEEVSK
ncbi:MAG: type II toxin-antitoxin system RelE/ParE family toxin [Spirochaetaceae bacterium]|nr:type II toxin-antitoxin system RelE/ParE family toxin [Spirochaetaceae bacterium]